MAKKNKRTKKRNQNRSNSDLVSPEIFLKGGKQSELIIVQRVLEKARKISKLGKASSLFHLARQPMLPRSMHPLFNSPEKFRNLHSVAQSIEPEDYVFWLLGLLKQHAELIKYFNEKRSHFNDHLLQGNGEQALASLDQLETKTVSWWSIENRMHLLREIFQKPAKHEIQKIEERLRVEGCKSFTQRLLMMSESTSISFFCEFIMAQLNEYRSSGDKDAELLSNSLSCMNLPATRDHLRVPKLESLYFYASESLIDQYVLLKSLLTQIDVFGLQGEIFEYLQDIAKSTCDTELKEILSEREEPAISYVEAVVLAYTEGNYRNCVEMIEENLACSSIECSGLIEIYARSKIYLKEEFRDTYFDKISMSLMNIARVSHDCLDEIEYLRKICVKFRNEVWAKYLNFHLVCLLKEIEGESIVEIGRSQLNGNKKFATPKALCKDRKEWVVDLVPLSRIPEDRRARYGISDLRYDNYNKEMFQFFSDYLSLKVNKLLEGSLWLAAMQFCVDEYFANRLSQIFMPMEKLCEVATNIEKDDDDKYVLSLIVLDIYSIENNSSFDDQKSEIFEEYLEFHDSYKPSEIFEGKEISEKTFYLLKNICIPSELDNIIFYESNDEVVFERIKIIDLLINRFELNSDDLKSEKDRVIETLFSSKLRARLESGKLFVDVQALVSRRKESYRTLFNRAITVFNGEALREIEEESDVGASDNIFEIGSSGDLAIGVTSNEKTEIALKIFRSMVKDFVLDEDYGLDKYLSAEIRHFVFVSQLRSCFEKYNLITSSENEVYLPNYYWIEKYHYINNFLLDIVDDLFSDFSRSIDQRLKSTNNLFKINEEFIDTDEGDDKKRIFDFSAYYSRLVTLSEILVESPDFDHFFEALVQFMWDICGEHAKLAQSLINDELKVEVIKEIDLLEARIDGAKGTAAMVDLVQDIRSARSDFLNQIELVLNWFKPAGSDNSSNQDSLRVVIETSISAFESIYKHKSGDLNVILPDSNLLLNYRESRSLFVALFTALENAARYKKLGSDIHLVKINEESQSRIFIRNEIDKGVISDPKVFIEQQWEKFRLSNSSLSRQEGGSGLFKIYNHLQNASEGFSLDLEVGDRNFEIIIGLKNEDFTGRR